MAELYPGSTLFPSSSLFPEQALQAIEASQGATVNWVHDLTSDAFYVPGMDARSIQLSHPLGTLDLIPDAFVESVATTRSADRIMLSSIEGLYDDPVRRQARDARTDRHGTDVGPTLLDERAVTFQGSIFAGNFPKMREMIGNFKRSGFSNNSSLGITDSIGTLKFVTMRPPHMTGGTYEIDNSMMDPLFEIVGTTTSFSWRVFVASGLALTSGPTIDNAHATLWVPRNRSNTACRVTATHSATAGSTVIFVEQQPAFGSIFIVGDVAPMWFKALVNVADAWATSMTMRIMWFRDFETTLPSLVRASDEVVVSAPATGMHLLKLNSLTPPRDAQAARMLLRFESTTASDTLDVRLLGSSASYRDSPIESANWPGWSKNAGAQGTYELNRDRITLSRRTGKVNWARPGRAAVLAGQGMGEWVLFNTAGLVGPVAEVQIGKSLDPTTPSNAGYLFRVSGDQPADTTFRELGMRSSTTAPAANAVNGGWTGRVPIHEGQILRITARARVIAQENNAARTVAPNAVFLDLGGGNVPVGPASDPVGNGQDGLPAYVRAGTAPGDYSLYFERAAPAGSGSVYPRFLTTTTVSGQKMEFLLDYITVSIDDPKHSRDPVAAYNDGDSRWWRWHGAQGTTPSYTQGQPDAYQLRDAQVVDFKMVESQPDQRIKRDFMLTVKAADPRFYEERTQIRYANGPSVATDYITQNNPGTFTSGATRELAVNAMLTSPTLWNQTPYTTPGHTQARNSATGAALSPTIPYAGTFIPSASISSASRIAAARVNPSRASDGSWGTFSSDGYDMAGVVIKRFDSTNYLYGVLRSNAYFEIRCRSTALGDQLGGFIGSVPATSLAATAAAGRLWIAGAVDPFNLGEHKAYFWVLDGHPLSNWTGGGPSNIIGMVDYDFSGTPTLVTAFGATVAGKRGWVIGEDERANPDVGFAPTVFSYEEFDRSATSPTEVLVNVVSMSTIDFPYKVRIDGPVNGPRVDAMGLSEYRYVGFAVNLAVGEYIEYDTRTNYFTSSMLSNHGGKLLEKSDFHFGSSWGTLVPGNTQIRLTGTNMNTTSKLTVSWEEAYV